MQSTGLQDKNDKEIFEGDVVRCPVEAPFQTTHGEWVDHQVLYRNGVWIVSYLRSASGDVLPRGYTAGDTTTYRELDGKDVVFSDNDAYKKLTIEVIGNIYENPELFSPSTTSIQS